MRSHAKFYILNIPVGDLFLEIFFVRCGGRGDGQSDCVPAGAGGRAAAGSLLAEGSAVAGAGSAGGGSAECRRSASNQRCASAAPSACNNNQVS